MSYLRKLVGKKCYLSPPIPEDAPLWTAWLNDLDIVVPLGDEAFQLISHQSNSNFIRDIATKQFHVYTIVKLVDNTPIGRIILFNINQIDSTAMIGLFIGEKAAWGQGYAQEAMQLLLEYAFSLLNLNNIMLGVFAFNKRAIRLYERLGFQLIGRRRQARIIGGKKHDVIFMDLLAEEFNFSFLNLTNL